MELSPAGFVEACATQAREPTAADTIARLALLDAISYDKCRQIEAERLGIRVTTLDAQVEKERERDADPAHGRRVTVKLPEPWPEPVRLADVLDELAKAVERHVIVSAAARDIIALWITHTWAYERFQQTPRLLVQSPEKRCGKSTLLELLRLTCRNAVKADSVSSASVFRIVEALRPLTLLIDEADSFLKDNEELRGVLNSGFEQTGCVLRVVETQGEHVPVMFATFAPVAIAAIGKLPDTITDRGLPIRMERKSAGQHIARLREGGRDALLAITRRLYRWATDDAGKLSPAPAIPDALNDRQGDLAVPLLAIAEQAGGEWLARCRNALLALFNDRADAGEDEGLGATLLADIRAAFDTLGQDVIASGSLANALVAMEDRPWAEWRRGQPMTPLQLARALDPFRVRPGNVRTGTGGGVARGYRRSQFEDAWARYCPNPSSPPHETATVLQPAENRQKSEFQAATATNHVAERISRKSKETAACSSVAGRNPLAGRKEVRWVG